MQLLGDAADSRAHRALDDTVALRHVSNVIAEGLPLSKLLRQFALALDLDKSFAVLSILLVV